MFKVRVKGEGIKLANKWYFINEEAIINLEEYKKNKEYVDIIEEIEEASTRKEQNLEGNNREDAEENNESEDKKLESLKEIAKELGIKNAHLMKKEKLEKLIAEKEAPMFE